MEEEEKKVKYQELIQGKHLQRQWQDDFGQMGQLCYGD